MYIIYSNWLSITLSYLCKMTAIYTKAHADTERLFYFQQLSANCFAVNTPPPCVQYKQRLQHYQARISPTREPASNREEIPLG